jgi:hypothetical protein
MMKWELQLVVMHSPDPIADPDMSLSPIASTVPWSQADALVRLTASQQLGASLSMVSDM